MTTISIDRHTSSNGGLRLAVTGALDMSTGDLLATMIRNAITAAPVAELVVDLDRVSFCDSSGIKTLIAGQHLATEHGIVFQVINPHGIVARTLDVTGVLPVLNERS